MRCFYHNDHEAVGTCRLCSKGLCPECLTDLDVAIGCKGRHEELARRIAMTQARATRLATLAPAFFILMGLSLSAWGLMVRPLSVFMVIQGLIMAGAGLLLFRKVSASSVGK